MGMVLLMASTTASAQVALPTTEKATYTRSLSGQWDFKYIAGSSAGSDSLFFMPEYDTGAWKTIKVPGNWELQGFAGMTYGKKVRAGLGLYRRTIDIPAEWDGRGIYLCLEGVNFGYTLYVDGHEAGSFNSSYNRQTFDITRFAQPGHTHTLAVRVDTRPRGFEFDTNDDWSLSGISRNVLLFALPKVHIDDITIHTSMDGRVDIEALVAGKGKKDKTVIEGEITDAEGNRVASLASAATTSARHRAAAGVPQPHLWTAETPYLYTVSLRLKLNGQTVQTYNGKVGIREIAWDGGIYRINGRPVKFHGATHHDLSPVNGRSITDEEMKRDLQMMKDANMNFLRIPHYPPAPRLLELCDSIGMYVMCDVPFGFGESNLKDSTFLDDLKNRGQPDIATRQKPPLGSGMERWQLEPRDRHRAQDGALRGVARQHKAIHIPHDALRLQGLGRGAQGFRPRQRIQQPEHSIHCLTPLPSPVGSGGVRQDVRPPHGSHRICPRSGHRLRPDARHLRGDGHDTGHTRRVGMGIFRPGNTRRYRQETYPRKQACRLCVAHARLLLRHVGQPGNRRHDVCRQDTADRLLPGTQGLLEHHHTRGSAEGAQQV